jgi:hypothetical protein
MDYDQQLAWLTLDSPHVFVQPLGHGYYPPHIAQEIVGLIKDAVEVIFTCSGVKVTSPTAASPPQGLDRAPYTHLIRNISPAIAAALVKQRCWATQKIAFLVYPAVPQMPTYLGAIQGLNVDADDIPDIFKLVSTTFSQDPIYSILADISASHSTLAALQPDERVKQITSSLQIDIFHVRSSGGSPRPIVNLYIDPPSDKDDNWSRLLQIVSTTTYKDAFMGSGTYHAGWSCGICHSVDHPSGLCKFPSLPHWINASPIPPLLQFREQYERPYTSTHDPTPNRRGGRNPHGRGSAPRGSTRYGLSN